MAPSRYRSPRRDAVYVCRCPRKHARHMRCLEPCKAGSRARCSYHRHANYVREYPELQMPRRDVLAIQAAAE